MLEGDQHQPPLCSPLLKRAKWRLAWDQRFFVLDGLRLSYRVDADGPVKKSGTIVSLLKQVDSSTSCGFRVWLKGGECWALRAQSSEVHQMWVDRITELLKAQESIATKNVRRGVVLKQGAWSGKWRQRYVEVDGCRMAYRETAKSAVRRRYEVVSVDVQRGEDGNRDMMLLVSEEGESFWLRFTTEEQCEDWRRVIVRGCRRSWQWQWRSVVPLRQSPACEVTLQFHASSCRVGDSSTIYCFGGSTISAYLRYFPDNNMFFPIVQRGCLVRDLVCMQLCAQCSIDFVDALPYEESKHAKVRPPALLGAAMCAIEMVSSGGSGTSFHSSRQVCAATACESTAANRFDRTRLTCLLLVGGRGDAGAVNDTTTEVWWCALTQPKAQWFRTVVHRSSLPNRTFHTLTAVGARQAVLVGGVDENNDARSECFLVSWPSEGEVAAACNSFSVPPTVAAVAALPYPLALHAAVVLRDGSLLVVGGGNVSHGAVPACSEMFRLADVAGPWTAVKVKPPLPSMYNIRAVVAVVEDEEYVLVLGERRNSQRAPKLYRIALQTPTEGRMEEITLAGHFIPQCSFGASMHVSDDYLYIIGGRVCGPLEGGYNPGTLMNEPIRSLIGVKDSLNDSEDGTE